MIDSAFANVYEFYLAQTKARPRDYTHARGLFESAKIFSSAELERHLNNPLLTPAWVQIVEKGETLDLKDSWLKKNVQGRELNFLDKTVLHESLARGAALVLEGLDILDARLNSFVAALDEALPCVLANCETFYSQSGNEAYYGHRDSDDVLVLQIEGRKIWHLYEPQPRRYFGNAPLTEEEMAPKLIELEMNPGDALYVRAGVPHRCQTPDAVSLHVSFDLIDKTPTVEQISHEANDRYFHASAEPYSDTNQVIDHYMAILGDASLREKSAQVHARARGRVAGFRAAIGRSSTVRLPRIDK